MVSVVYYGRALPLAWVVVPGQQGHFPQATHCALIAQIQHSIPPTAEVIVLGDGEFDGAALQAMLQWLPWQYVCRTAPSITITVYGRQVHIDDLVPTRGELLAVRPAWMTAKPYGPVSILAIWEAAYAEPM
jgi:hypothetical protein